MAKIDTYLFIGRKRAKVQNWINRKIFRKLDYSLIEQNGEKSTDYSYQVICDFLATGTPFVALNISPYEEEVISLLFKKKMNKKDCTHVQEILKVHGLNHLNDQELRFLGNNLKRCLDECDIIITSKKKAEKFIINPNVASAKILIDDRITIDFFGHFKGQLIDKKILFIGESSAHNFEDLNIEVIQVSLDTIHSFVEVFDDLKLKVLKSDFDLMITDIKMIGNLICDFAITLNKSAINLTSFY